ncbi:DNA-binding protein H-NS [Vibrio astriarenae]|nr:DNA-binding protein H-NS [Vibrio sp. C7]
MAQLESITQQISQTGINVEELINALSGQANKKLYLNDYLDRQNTNIRTIMGKKKRGQGKVEPLALFKSI